jgi:glycosyltransferase involved in cell wall biosynthesis
MPVAAPSSPFVFLAAHPWQYEGGSEYLWQRTALWLRQQGYPVLICVHDFGPLSGDLERLRKEGARFHFRSHHTTDRVPPVNRLHQLGRFFDRLQGKKTVSLPTREETLSWVKEQNPVLVVINQSENRDGAWWMEQMSLTAIPYVTITNNGGSELWPNDYEVLQLSQGMSGARRNYFPSENTIRWMETHLGSAIPQASLFVNSCQVRYRPDCSWPQSDNPLAFAMVGRLDPKSKGHELAFGVLALPQWRDRPVNLTVYGDGLQADGLRRLTNLWNLNRVHFSGKVQDIESIWKKHHYLLQPSRYEGLPCTLKEAMLCARGAVVTDVGGNAELVQDGVSGFVAPYATVKSLAGAMERCWERRAEARGIGQAARLRAEVFIPEKPEEVFGLQLLELSSAEI